MDSGSIHSLNARTALKEISDVVMTLRTKVVSPADRRGFIAKLRQMIDIYEISQDNLGEAPR